MEIEKQDINKDLSRDLFWTRIIFSAPDNTRRSSVLAAATEEYFRASQEFQDTGAISDEAQSKWSDTVLKKWIKLGERIFENPVHYDVYANSPEGESNGLKFLLSK